MTPYAEVIGDPIAQSKSPTIHNFWLKKLGMEGDYRAIQVTPAELEGYLQNRRGDPAWRGCNVTMPLKQAIVPLLDSVDQTARSIGAVNTVYPTADRHLTGTNTDAAGFLEPLAGELAQTHYFRMARIFGAGGAARAIVTALAGHGFTLVLAARDLVKARSLLDELDPHGDHHVTDIAHFASPTDFSFDDREGCLDLVVNASPLGMRGQSTLEFDFSHAPPGSLVYDIVTDPLDTAFLGAARASGFRTVDGLSMLIGQAAEAFKLFFGAAPPRTFDDELRALIAR